MNDVEKFWTKHNVTDHKVFKSAADSLEYFHWRNNRSLGYIDRMPVKGLDGLDVLDFGCGPGNDVVGIMEFSEPNMLVGADISKTSLEEAKTREKLHGFDLCAFFPQVSDETPKLPWENDFFDYIHCSGVIHHVSYPAEVLAELRRVLRPDGRMRLMTHNWESVFAHVHVAYVEQVTLRNFRGLSTREALGKLTDTEECPIARAYTETEFIALARSAGFVARHLGNAITWKEIDLAPRIQEALEDERVDKESREFLERVNYDPDVREKKIPRVDGEVAGIYSCFELT
jgi:ubiquinone/menaquinone biosynthesis C-methylase UbiE